MARSSEAGEMASKTGGSPMWILTDFGFFSVVRKPEDVEGGMLTVRGRVKADLEALRSRYLEAASPISEDMEADYRYRFRVEAGEFGTALRIIVMDIDYQNFKKAVIERQGPIRHEIYGLLWQVLSQLWLCDLGTEDEEMLEESE
jgi:hypothetical protein